MLKRSLYVEERTCLLAVWSLRLSLFALAVIALTAGLYRTGHVGFQPMVVALVSGFVMALGGGVIGVIAFASIWESGWRGMGKAIGAIALALMLLAGPAAVLARGLMLPPLTDVATDPLDPPQFRAMGFARPRDANPAAYPGAAAAALQHSAYPGLKPVDLDATPEEAFNAVLSLVNARRWRVLDIVPPRGGVRDGQIEAIVIDPILGFRSDLVIRVRPTAKGARVDARSTSRYGTHDLGDNAARLSRLMADLSAERRKKH